jgi:Na+-driven multidrug efflux pump
MCSLIAVFLVGLVLGYILGFTGIVGLLVGTTIDWIVENFFRLFR